MTVTARYVLPPAIVLLMPMSLSAQTNRPAFNDPKLQSAVIRMEEGLRRFNKVTDPNDKPLQPRIVTKKYSEQVTLLGAAGGIAKGSKEVRERQERISSKRAPGGEVTVEYNSWGEGDDMAYTVTIERRIIREAGKDQPRSSNLRSTTIFRKEGDEWVTVHRHADPLVDEAAR
jgi:ketosteroid isomerase-like protein